MKIFMVACGYMGTYNLRKYIGLAANSMTHPIFKISGSSQALLRPILSAQGLDSGEVCTQ